MQGQQGDLSEVMQEIAEDLADDVEMAFGGEYNPNTLEKWPSPDPKTKAKRAKMNKWPDFLNSEQ